MDSAASSTVDNLLDSFEQHVASEKFYEACDSIVRYVKDVEKLIHCAYLAQKRLPGGTFYSAKFWSEALSILQDQVKEEDQIIKSVKRICKKIGIYYRTVKTHMLDGMLLLKAESELKDANILREVSPTIFKNARQQKDKGIDYLVEASTVLATDSAASSAKIHQHWCRKNGSIKSKLDIIKPSDWWAFSHPKWRQENDFSGSIPGEIYANALYYFAPRQGLVVDAMAGSGMLKRVYDDRERWQKDSNFQLDVRLFDIKPCRDFIQKHDAHNPLPIKADWIFIDPPYFGQSSHLFDDDLANAPDYQTYLKSLKLIICSLSQSLNPCGRLCIFLPKWSGLNGNDPNYNVPADAFQFALDAGLKWIDTAHVSRGRQQEGGSARKNNIAKQIRRMRSDTCVLNVFEKQE